MCEPISMGILAAGSLAMAGYGMYKQNQAAKDAKAEQDRANKEAKAAILEKGPEAALIDDGELNKKRIASLQAGWANSFKTSKLGDLSKPATANMGLPSTGTKTTLGG